MAGDTTLLNNFSEHIIAEALSQSYIVKEYYLMQSNPPSLNITFRPSEKSFAFVNGVEVIALPEHFPRPPPLVDSGGDSQVSVRVPINSTSMELMHRLNVGGQYIPPPHDSGGLMRTWYDDSVGVAIAANITVGYKSMPPYTAPLDVYATYRSMGASADVNKATDMTWIFKVDPGFRYLVRLHWCDSEMKRVNQRVFDVMINNITAAHDVDLFTWTGAVETPTWRDYVVRVENGTVDECELWLTVRPSNLTRPEFMNVLLNGLEIFKLSENGNSNLAGPNPMMSELMRKYLEGHKMGYRNFEQNPIITTIVIVGSAGAASVGISAAVILVVYSRKKRAAATGDSRTSWLPVPPHRRQEQNTPSSTETSMLGRSRHGSRAVELGEGTAVARELRGARRRCRAGP